MDKLRKPGMALAKRILREVGFENRLIGYKLHQRLGPREIALYSLEEVIGLLSERLRYIDLESLEKWLREIMGDLELAERIKRLLGMDLSDHDKMNRAAELMGMRLWQCQKIANRET